MICILSRQDVQPTCVGTNGTPDAWLHVQQVCSALQCAIAARLSFTYILMPPQDVRGEVVETHDLTSCDIWFFVAVGEPAARQHGTAEELLCIVNTNSGYTMYDEQAALEAAIAASLADAEKVKNVLCGEWVVCVASCLCLRLTRATWFLGQPGASTSKNFIPKLPPVDQAPKAFKGEVYGWKQGAGFVRQVGIVDQWAAEFARDASGTAFLAHTLYALAISRSSDGQNSKPQQPYVGLWLPR